MSNTITNETLIDVFKPPEFEPYAIKPFKQAVIDGEWIGVVNIWLVREHNNRLEVLFQKRPDNSYFAAGLFDVAVGGHYVQGQYESGEHLLESKEELGITLDKKKTYKLDRRLVALINQNTRRERKLVCDIYLSILEPYDSKLNTPEDEVAGLMWIEVNDLIDLYDNANKEYTVKGFDNKGKSTEYLVSSSSFISNFDGYHQKTARLIKLWHDGHIKLEPFAKPTHPS